MPRKKRPPKIPLVHKVQLSCYQKDEIACSIGKEKSELGVMFTRIESILNNHRFTEWFLDTHKALYTKDIIESKTGKNIKKLGKDLLATFEELDNWTADLLGVTEINKQLRRLILPYTIFGEHPETGEYGKHEFQSKFDQVLEWSRSEPNPRAKRSLRARNHFTIPELAIIFDKHAKFENVELKIERNLAKAEFIQTCLRIAKITCPEDPKTILRIIK